jgi:hypothetical protein
VRPTHRVCDGSRHGVGQVLVEIVENQGHVLLSTQRGCRKTHYRRGRNLAA